MCRERDNFRFGHISFVMTLASAFEARAITYSIVNQPDYDDGEGCMTGVPQFTSDYRLQPDSPGSNAASDSLDMGLFPLSVLR